MIYGREKAWWLMRCEGNACIEDKSILRSILAIMLFVMSVPSNDRECILPSGSQN